jgi:hypothetical protein
MSPQQGLDPSAQGGVIGAGLAKIRGPLGGIWQRDSCGEYRFNAIWRLVHILLLAQLA